MGSLLDIRELELEERLQFKALVLGAAEASLGHHLLGLLRCRLLDHLAPDLPQRRKLLHSGRFRLGGHRPRLGRGSRSFQHNLLGSLLDPSLGDGDLLDASLGSFLGVWRNSHGFDV